MAEAADIHGTVFQNGSATLLARVVDANAVPVVPDDIATIHYSICLLDEYDANRQTPVVGHTDVDVSTAGLIQASLVTDDLWDVDAQGYNFKHAIDVATQPAFTIAGRSYRVTYRLTPNSGQVILVRFRLFAI